MDKGHTQPRGVQKAAIRVGAVTALAVATLLLWAQSRGFDLLDGGYYLLLYQNPSENPDTYTRFHWIARPLWLACGENLVAFRILCLILATAAAAIFWRAWRRHVTGCEGYALGACALWLAVMASFTDVPVALTYNSLPTLFILIGLSLFLGLLGRSPNPGETQGPRLFAYALLPLLLAGIYVAKPPAAIAFLVAAYGFACVHPALPGRLRRILAWVTAVGVAAAAVGLLAVLGGKGFDSEAGIQVAGLMLSADWVQHTLTRYAGELAVLTPAIRGDFAWTALPAVLAMGASLGSRKAGGSRAVDLALALLLTSVLAALGARRLWDGSFNAAVSGEAARFYLLLWGSLLPLWFVAVVRTRESVSLSHIVWVLLLFAMPWISALGTTNTLYLGAMHLSILWAAGLLLASDRIGLALQSRWFAPALACVISVGAIGHIVSGQVWKPYMFQPSLWAQTEPVQIGNPATTVRLDPARAHFLTEVRSILTSNGFKPGDDLFGFFNLPGVVFAVGGREPGAPWYFGTWYGNSNVDTGKIRDVSEARRKSAWIITQDNLLRFKREFHDAGIDFPEGYKMIGHTTNPASSLEIAIWKPLSRP